jgi:hypothetical protein
MPQQESKAPEKQVKKSVRRPTGANGEAAPAAKGGVAAPVAKGGGAAPVAKGGGAATRLNGGAPITNIEELQAVLEGEAGQATPAEAPAKGGGKKAGRKGQTAATADASQNSAGEEGGKKARKGRKDKVIRDSFTMPRNDYDKIGELKKRLQHLGVAAKKSELLRAGLHALEQLSDAQLKQRIEGVEKIKTGRPG